MKKYLLMAAAAMMAVSTVFAAGDEVNGHAYFTKAELPDMTKILPPFPAFELARARAEFKEKAGESTPVNSARIVSIKEGPAYTLQGTPATASTRGIVIEGNQKVVRK